VKEYNIKRHYETVHIGWDELYPPKSESRKQKLELLRKARTVQQAMFPKQTNQTVAATQAYFRIAWRLAQARKPFVDGQLMKECFNIACETMFPADKNLKIQMNTIPLSASTVTLRTEAASIDVGNQLQTELAGCDYFSLALDESTDITDTAQLAIFVRFIMPDFEIKEELLGLCGLKGTTTGLDIKSAVVQLMKTLSINPAKLSAVTNRWSSINVRTGKWIHSIVAPRGELSGLPLVPLSDTSASFMRQASELEGSHECRERNRVFYQRQSIESSAI